jgi:hypothetical protein
MEFLSLILTAVTFSTLASADPGSPIPIGEVLEDSTTHNRIALFCVEKKLEQTMFGEESLCTNYQILKYHRNQDKEIGYQKLSEAVSIKDAEKIGQKFSANTGRSFEALQFSEWYCDFDNGEICFYPVTGMIWGVGTIFFVGDMIAIPFKAIGLGIGKIHDHQKYKRLKKDFFSLVYGTPQKERSISHKRFASIEQVLAK